MDILNDPHKNVYLDANGGLPTSMAALRSMMETCYCCNPSNLVAKSGRYAEGHHSKAIDKIKSLLLSKKSKEEWDFVSTSGATEGNVTALRSAADPDYPILLLDGYHPAVPQALEEYDIGYVICDPTATSITQALSNNMFSAMFVTHTLSLTGETVPLDEIRAAYLTNYPSSPIILDATQSVGKMEMRVDRLGVDVFIFSSHKFGGPKGCGGVLLRKNSSFTWRPLIPGSQQNSLRGGTINVMGVVGMAAALDDTLKDISRKVGMTKVAIEGLVREVEALALPRVEVLSPAPGEAKNTMLLSLPFCSKRVANRLREVGYDVGIGTACQTATVAATQSTDPAERTQFLLRISLPIGKGLDAKGFSRELRNAFRLVLRKLQSNVEGDIGIMTPKR